MHNVLKSHGRVYRLYREKYYQQQQGKISITISSRFVYPHANARNGDELVERAMQFQIGWVAQPLYKGNYPQVMVDRIANNSRSEGHPRSRLPAFTQEWSDLLRGTLDYFSLNYYTSRVVEEIGDGPQAAQKENFGFPSWDYDLHVRETVERSWKRSQLAWLYSVPEGMGDILRFAHFDSFKCSG